MALGQEFHFRDKVRVALLGATGAVGRRFVELLANHPWFELKVLAASEKSAGKKYGSLVELDVSPEIKNCVVKPCDPQVEVNLAFSALNSSVAGKIEEAFRDKGIPVVTNASSHRYDSDVPLVVPEINLKRLTKVSGHKGCIVANTNCVVAGLTLALKPLYDAFGIEGVDVVTLQSLSGGGCRAMNDPELKDNVVPFIVNEEKKILDETLKVLEADFKMSAQVFRVPVAAGHTAAVTVKFKKQVAKEEIVKCWEAFRPFPDPLEFPSAPSQPILYSDEKSFPQPKHHLYGMAVSIGQLKEKSPDEWKFVLLSDNLTRGAAGGAILIAEAMLRDGYIYW